MKEKIKIHIYGLPHTLTVRDNPQMMTCAYTTKIWLLCKKFMEEGHEVIHYGVEIPKNFEGKHVPCTEHVSCIPFDIWEKTHGKRNIYTYHQHEVNMPTYQLAEKTFIEEISKRVKDPSKEVILASFGFWSYELLKLTNLAALCEFGIGYDAVFAPYKVFESYSWMHTVYGIKDTHLKAPGWFDAVVPGYVDPEEFEFKKEKDNYFLFVGRIMDTKGIFIAAQLAKEYGFRLVVAGNGDVENVKKLDNVEYVGVVGVGQKRKLYANAKATLTMSQYVEPFGNVHIESLISGTPVITTDWGVYVESVPHGMVGYRGRTWEDFKYAIENVDKIDTQTCRDWAMANFTLDAVYPKFNAYFNKIASHYSQIKDGKGWYFEQGSSKEDYFVNYWKNYEKYTKTHVVLMVDDIFFNMAYKAIESFSAFHENFDFTILQTGSLSEKNLNKFKKLPNFKRVIKSIYEKSSWSRFYYLDEIASSGKLLIIDSDLFFRENIKDFLTFNGKDYIHAVDDGYTFSVQNDFNKDINEEETYFNEIFVKEFDNLPNYKQKITINAGVIAFDLNNKKSFKVIKDLKHLTKKFADIINFWPAEQGMFNHYIYNTGIIDDGFKMFDPYYNSSYCSLREPYFREGKVIHYHNQDLLQRILTRQ